MEGLYRNYKEYLIKKYGDTTYRVGVDGGFSCPNRELGGHGCSYCDEYGIRSAYLGEAEHAMDEQIRRSIAAMKKRYQAKNFILYFQAFSSTHGPVEQLKRIYDQGLALGDFKELVVSTRPDCIDDARADLLSSYSTQVDDVWVELGLQSSHDCTLDRIHRGHGYSDFLKAYEILRSRGIKVAVHLILGLPGENRAMILQTVERVAALHPQGVKFHNLHIPTGSALYKEFERGELLFPGNRRYLSYLADSIERLSEECLIMRLNTDTPSSRHGLPGAFWNKSRLQFELDRLLTERGSFQGAKFP